ncbi:MAG TPA: LytTR family DNA-binding domain-containing protein [Bacteroidales bacterium]|nr:LytTR family DNA-binding domain-containing protein [Bacteroidales bacterium]HPT01592.1 LytTR family DNA-binding domain-containing protein [Bacteroidales bacterium]
MKIQTIAIDDEPLALKLISGYIRQTPFLECAGEFDNPISAIEFIESHETDLVFLDIQMPDLIGTDLARYLQNGPKIVFATAYEKFALEGFRLQAVDYLLKPFGYDEFLIAANKARNLIELEQKTYPLMETNDEFLFVKSEYKIRRINYDDVLYIEGMKDYVKIFLRTDARPILSINSLKTLEEKLPASQFMRVHRSFIVNLNRVDTIERFRIVFGKTYIPVGEAYKEHFQKFLNENFL